MSPRKAQIIWSSIVAAAVALLALHSLFSARPVSHVFLKAGSTPASNAIRNTFKDGFEIR